jgi:hypothetical protein
MPGMSKKTPHAMATLVEMHGQGGSWKEIGAAIGIDPQTAARWGKTAGLAPNGGSGPRKGRQRRAGFPGPANGTPTPLPTPGDGESIDPDQARARVVRRLAMLTTMADQAGAEGNGPLLATCTKLEKELAAEIVALAPPTPPDPENDPSNIQAADACRLKLASLVSEVEKTLRCVHCGRHPYES